MTDWVPSARFRELEQRVDHLETVTALQTRLLDSQRDLIDLLDQRLTSVHSHALRALTDQMRGTTDDRTDS